MHSGAGRIVSIRMRPLSFAERGLQSPTVSLARLLEGHHDVPAFDRGSVGIEAYVDEILASGLPGIRPLGSKNRTRALAGYVQAIVNHEFPEQGHSVRKPESLLGWLRAYAAATATTASYSTILAAATPGVADKPARSTTEAYRNVLAQLWLLDPLPAWTPQAGHFTRLGASPKHYLADPALAAALLGLRHDDLLLPGRGPAAAARAKPVLGALFEHLVALSVLTYADLAEARVAHFRRQDDDREVDLIVERGASVVAIEVKASPEVSDGDVRHLLWLRERLGDRLAAAVIVTTGHVAYPRPDGVLVVPLAHLGP
jgi:predicted AAA+ superfamily ATPase